MNKFRFLEWNVYRESKELLNTTFNIVGQLPKEYRYELGSQMIRSAFSIVLNMAEGSGKRSDKEMNRYFEIALGSASETLAAADVLRDKIDGIARQSGGFKKKLDN